MASYEYKCKLSPHVVILNRGMTEDEIVPYCDTCHERMVRVYSSAPVKFKSKGFYSTGG